MSNKSSVTLEMVSEAVVGLIASGVVQPGALAVRNYLSSKALPGAAVGSLGTIQMHLDSLRPNKRGK